MLFVAKVDFNDNWLPHLKNSVPQSAFGYTVSMYSVALEGWRRGLRLKFINNNRTKAKIDYSLSDGDKEHFFSVTRGDAVPKSAISICVHKEKTKKYLRQNGVPTPKGNMFGATVTDEEIIQYSHTIGYPVVVKPSDGTGGNGVIANIKDENELKNALFYVRKTLGFSEVILESHFHGEDYRIYVIDNKVIGGLKKIPANVIGDGKSTIKDLIKKKNNARNNTPAFYKRRIKIDQELHNILKSKGYTLDSVPEKGTQVYLKTKNNISAGGDPVDVTDKLTAEIKDIAINASRAIPGLIQCGVDIMVNTNSNTGVVLEVNSRPHITAQLYPWHGKARDIPKAIIDYYFPETTSKNFDMFPRYYFDFKSVFENFQAGIIKEYVVPDIPKGDLQATRFIISGKLQGVNYEKWIQKQARKLNIHGYVKSLNDGKISVIASGKQKAINQFRTILKKEAPKRVRVKDVIEKERKSPIKIGFEIIQETSEIRNFSEKSKAVKTSYENKTNYSIRQDTSKDGYFPIALSNIVPK